MAEVGVRELKTRASAILRDVRDRQVRYTVTYRGRPVGVLIPIADARADAPEAATAWDDLMRLGEEIGSGWRSPLSSTELLSQMRR